MTKPPPPRTAPPRVRTKGDLIVFEGDTGAFAVTRAEARDIIAQLNAALTRAEPAEWDVEDHTPERIAPWTEGRGKG